jgi:hypothetical protein
VGRLFGLTGELTELRPLGRGHIHRTFLAGYRDPGGSVVRVVHQRVNTEVFADPATLMSNLARVTSHLGTRAGAGGRTALRLRRATHGGPAAVDGDGAVWRTLAFVEGARTWPRFTGPAQAGAAAAVAARLVADLADLPGPPLAEVLPGFHDVVGRLGRLERAVVADTESRAGTCRPEVDTVRSFAGVAHDVAEARADGRLPERTVHNDAKADNVLFDERSGDPVCLIDLDTVGPGTVLVDVGDLVRSGAATGAEDGDPTATGVRVDVVEAILAGYARAGSEFLTPAEVDLFPQAGPLMALEAATRFLTDHLEGDVYFRVDGPRHNLRRARNQLRVLELLS